MSDETPTKKKVLPARFLVIFVVAVFGLYFWQHYEFGFDSQGHRGFYFQKRGAVPTTEQQGNAVDTEIGTSKLITTVDIPKEVMPLKTIRIATWDLAPLDFNKLADTIRASQIAEVIGEFDLVAVQGVVQTTRPLDEIVRLLKTKGKRYTYVTPLNIGSVPEYVAFLFNVDTIKVDRDRVFDFDEPSLSYQPLVAAFCAAEPPLDKTFTFNLINVKIKEDRADVETRALGSIFRTVRDRYTAEDDVIMAGNFGIDAKEIASLTSIPYMNAIVTTIPTVPDGIGMPDNIVYDNKRTVEYVGNAHVIDVMSRFGLSIAEAGAFANHLPVSCEFSVFEAGNPGR